MHVRALILLALALGAFPAAAHASAESPASVRVLSCSPWQEGVGGTVSYDARMRAVPDTERMALRIRLLEKQSNAERFSPLEAEGLGVWRKSRPGASVFNYEQQVRGLRYGAVYRAHVDYRWLNRAGERIRTVEKISPPCRQGGGPPNLRIAGVAVGQGAVENTALYNVTVVNRGDSEARGVGVLLRVDGEVVDESEVIESLAPGESRTISFRGPLCRNRLRAVVDPKDAIAESREDDNVRTAECG